MVARFARWANRTTVRFIPFSAQSKGLSFPIFSLQMYLNPQHFACEPAALRLMMN